MNTGTGWDCASRLAGMRQREEELQRQTEDGRWRRKALEKRKLWHKMTGFRKEGKEEQDEYTVQERSVGALCAVSAD